MAEITPEELEGSASAVNNNKMQERARQGHNPLEGLNKRVARRALVTGVAVAGVGLAVRALLGSKGNEEVQSVPGDTGVENAVSKSLFVQIRQKLVESSDPAKNEALAFVAKLERTEQVINDLVTLNESQKESDGVPTLIKIEMERVRSSGISLLYPNLSPQDALRRYAEDQIFFLRDNKNLSGIKNVLENASSQSPATLTNQLRQYQDGYEGAFFLDYSKVDTKHHLEGNTSVTVDLSVTADATKTVKVNKMRSATTSFLSSAPKIGDRTVRIISGSQGEYIANENRMDVGVDYEVPEELLAHEFGHYIDDENLQNLSPYLSSQEIFRSILAKRRLLLTYFQPRVDRFFSPDKRTAFAKMSTGAKLTEGEFQAYAAIDVDRKLIDEAKYADSEIGHSDILALSNRSGRDRRFENVVAFLDSQAADLGSLAAKHPFLKSLMDDIRTRAQVYDNYWTSVSPSGEQYGYDKNLKNWWSAFGDMARVYHIEQISTGKARTNPEELKKWLSLMRHHSNEYGANSWGMAILYKDRVVNQPQTLAGSALSTFS